MKYFGYVWQKLEQLFYSTYRVFQDQWHKKLEKVNSATESEKVKMHNMVEKSKKDRRSRKKSKYWKPEICKRKITGVHGTLLILKAWKFNAKQLLLKTLNSRMNIIETRAILNIVEKDMINWVGKSQKINRVGKSQNDQKSCKKSKLINRVGKSQHINRVKKV